MLGSSLYTPYIRIRAPFILHSIQVFHSPKHVGTLDWKICRNAFEKKIWQPLHWKGCRIRQNKTDWNPGKQIKTILNHCRTFPCIVLAIYIIPHTQTIHCSSSCSDNRDFRKRFLWVSVKCKTKQWNRNKPERNETKSRNETNETKRKGIKQN